MSVKIPRGIRFEQKDGTLQALRDSDEQKALHGLARALVANAVTGVTTGFKKDLDIVGVGYRAEVKGKNVVFLLGYSHPIEFPIPEGIQVVVEKQTHMTVSGADRALVGQVSANMRALRPPDPYKQKGVRITGERLKKKAGKAGAKAAA
jgi:large subunit ribosomal protein L6